MSLHTCVYESPDLHGTVALSLSEGETGEFVEDIVLDFMLLSSPGNLLEHGK